MYFIIVQENTHRFTDLLHFTGLIPQILRSLLSSMSSCGFPVESWNSAEFHGVFMETIWLVSQPFGFWFPWKFPLFPRNSKNSAGIPWETASLSLSKIVEWASIEHSYLWHLTWINEWAFFQLHNMPVQSVCSKLTNSCRCLATPKVNVSKHKHLIWVWSTTNNPCLPTTTNNRHLWHPALPVANSHCLSQPPSTSHNPQHMTTPVHTNENTMTPCHQARTW